MPIYAFFSFSNDLLLQAALSAVFVILFAVYQFKKQKSALFCRRIFLLSVGFSYLGWVEAYFARPTMFPLPPALLLCIATSAALRLYNLAERSPKPKPGPEAPTRKITSPVRGA